MHKQDSSLFRAYPWCFRNQLLLNMPQPIAGWTSSKGQVNALSGSRFVRKHLHNTCWGSRDSFMGFTVRIVLGAYSPAGARWIRRQFWLAGSVWIRLVWAGLYYVSY